MRRPRGFFVTGTDTGVGKTFISAALISTLAESGFRVAALKPVASGCRRHQGRLISADARRLHACVNIPQSLSEVTQYAFAPPVSPHLAARRAGTVIRIPPMRAAFQKQSRHADLVIVEGVGGWLAPLTDRLCVADLAVALRLPVILVIGLRLGALNHAFLTAEAIAARGLPLAGFVINVRDPRMRYRQSNIDTLKDAIAAPLLGVIPPLSTPAKAAPLLDTRALIGGGKPSSKNPHD